MSPKKSLISYSIFWNCGLILIGSFIQAIGFKALGEPQGFVPGGLFGISTLIYYKTGFSNTGLIYLVLNVPMFILGYIFISKRFLSYSFLSMLTLSLSFMVIDFQINLTDQLYAAVTFGVIVGAGAGIVLRSLGSNGGLDVVGVILNQRFNLGLGKFYFFFNCALFTFSFAALDNDLVIASMIAVFITSVTVDYCLSLFNQRKLALIISEKPQEIADQVMSHMKIGATFLPAIGAYHRKEKTVLMVVINNIQLKRLEEIVFTSDPYSMFIVENTFNVLGSTFSKRKIY
ncbi:YitT family protein [Desulfuromonas sp. AOP6]|uniref:YitT family protein n=1 Tax=Desulfuromonas sp. AOP6 TaxID=1566351 RepID=UPI00127D86F1|nr:YitT family protein [Desulfuromonas sp. AOP6]BCA80249.1 membrane protein [Desulfuromonas sp. AOP6]